MFEHKNNILLYTPVFSAFCKCWFNDYIKITTLGMYSASSLSLMYIFTPLVTKKIIHHLLCEQ